MENQTNPKPFKHSMTLKVFLIGLLFLIMLIPVALVEGLNQERMQYQKDVTSQISNQFGGPQTIIGPILSVPYYYTVARFDKYNNRYEDTQIHYAHFLPDDLNLSAKIKNEVRYRSIYEVPIFQSKMRVEGSFSNINFSKWSISSKDIIWDQAHLFFTTNNIQSINQQVVINVDNKDYQFSPASVMDDYFRDGLEVKIDLSGDKLKEKIPFNLELNFNGAEELAFVPIGQHNKINLESNWPHPNFFGAKLPQSREITKTGFKAEWKTLHFGRKFPDRWLEKSFDTWALLQSKFGVNFYQPVNIYQLTERAIKYACLFILLTFITFFLFEVLLKIKVHPIQYIMVGASLCIFYVLLLSFAEHIGFLFSYLGGSLATIILITSFSTSVLKNKQRGLIIGGLLAVLYTYLYVILQLESFSLIMGAIGLFLVMSIIMYITRKVDWYNLSSQTKGIKSNDEHSF